MAVTRSDMFQLSQEVTFQNRVQAALILACISISTENPTTTPFHRERANFCVQVLSAPTGTPNWVQLFSNTVATDTSVIGDATQAGTVALTAGNRATQAALVTDAHIDGAIAAEFNSFFRTPGT